MQQSRDIFAEFFALFANSFLLFFFARFFWFVLNVRYFFNLSFDMHKIVLTLTSSACVCVCVFACVLAWNQKRYLLVCECVSACLCLLLYFLSEKTESFWQNFRKLKSRIFTKKWAEKAQCKITASGQTSGRHLFVVSRSVTLKRSTRHLLVGFGNKIQGFD